MTRISTLICKIGLALISIFLFSCAAGHLEDVENVEAIHSIELGSGQSLTVGERKTLAFAVSDSAGRAVLVDPARVVFTVVSGNDKLSIVDQKGLGLAIGVARVVVSIAGIISNPEEVIVVGPSLPSYRFIDLGTLGGNYSTANDINSSDQIVGSSSNATGALYPYLWENGTIKNLDLFANYFYGHANSINSYGEIVGATGNNQYYPPLGAGSAGSHFPVMHAFLWQNDRMEFLENEILDFNEVPNSINDSGQAVGTILNIWHETPLQTIQVPVLWQGGQRKGLLPLDGSKSSFPYKINGSGQIAGASYTPNGSLHAVIWEDGGIRDLNDLALLPAGWTLCEARSINDAGEIVGWASTPEGNRAYLLRGRVITDLGGVASGNSAARAINSSGQIVGVVEQHAVLWDHGAIVDLNSYVTQNSGWVLVEATAINNAGNIAGNGKFNGSDRAFLLSNSK